MANICRVFLIQVQVHLFTLIQLQYNNNKARSLEDSPLTGLTVDGGLGNRWHCGKTRGWVGRGLFVKFQNVSVSSQM